MHQAVVTVLGQRFSSATVEQLLIAQLRDPAWDVRKEVVTILSQRLPLAQLEKEITPLLKDPVREVREAVGERLWILEWRLSQK